MSLTNATPRIIYGGINDKSRGVLSRGEVTYPQHAPLLRLWCETGPSETTYVGNDERSFPAIFGGESLSRRSKYYNLQSLAAERLLREGNGFFVKRLIPEGSVKARLVMGIELVADDVPSVYDRLNGFHYVGGLGVGNLTQPPVDGFKCRIVLMPFSGAVGTAVPVPGTLVSDRDGSQSTIYPLFEMTASYYGEAGNNLGLRIWAPTHLSNEVIDEITADEFKTRMFRVQFMQKFAGSNTPTVLTTALGDDYADVCFTPGTFSRTTDREYYISDTLIGNYEDDGVESGLSPITSPFNNFYMYSKNVELVQGLIFQRETLGNPPITATLTHSGMIDFLTGLDISGDPYVSTVFLGPLNGGISLGQGTTVYAHGAVDGDIDHTEYEKLVTIENLNFGKLGDMYENIALYPFSHLYDTGLSMDGKFAMMNVLGFRRDLKCIFTTYVEAEQRAPTLSEELSRAQVLESRLQAYPESTLYGTGVCRAEVVYQCGELMGGGYSKIVPQVIDRLVRTARFAGAGTGQLRDGADPDQYPNNRITEIKRLNVPYLNALAQNSAWSSGGTYSLTYDTRSNYYPCIRSIYADETSVLLSPITVDIACDLVRIITRVHAKFSGNAKITKEQLIERCDNEILSMINDRYANRVTVVPETYFTAEDDNNGFSWHCKIKLYANNPRTTLYFELETYRTEALEE